MVAVCRHNRITNILRVEIAGRLYTLLKVNWLTKPTEEQIKAYRRRNSIFGPDDLTKTVYTFNPHRDPTAFEMNSDGYYPKVRSSHKDRSEFGIYAAFFRYSWYMSALGSYLGVQ